MAGPASLGGSQGSRAARSDGGGSSGAFSQFAKQVQPVYSQLVGSLLLLCFCVALISS